MLLPSNACGTLGYEKDRNEDDKAIRQLSLL